MDAKKCDRCGQFYICKIDINSIEKTNVNCLYVVKQWKKETSPRTLDLCVECKHDLDEWFDKFKKEKKNG